MMKLDHQQGPINAGMLTQHMPVLLFFSRETVKLTSFKLSPSHQNSVGSSPQSRLFGPNVKMFWLYAPLTVTKLTC